MSAASEMEAAVLENTVSILLSQHITSRSDLSEAAMINDVASVVASVLYVSAACSYSEVVTHKQHPAQMPTASIRLVFAWCLRRECEC